MARYNYNKKKDLLDITHLNNEDFVEFLKKDSKFQTFVKNTVGLEIALYVGEEREKYDCYILEELAGTSWLQEKYKKFYNSIEQVNKRYELSCKKQNKEEEIYKSLIGILKEEIHFDDINFMDYFLNHSERADKFFKSSLRNPNRTNRVFCMELLEFSQADWVKEEYQKYQEEREKLVKELHLDDVDFLTYLEENCVREINDNDICSDNLLLAKYDINKVWFSALKKLSTAEWYKKFYEDYKN